MTAAVDGDSRGTPSMPHQMPAIATPPASVITKTSNGENADASRSPMGVWELLCAVTSREDAQARATAAVDEDCRPKRGALAEGSDAARALTVAWTALILTERLPLPLFRLPTCRRPPGGAGARIGLRRVR